MAKFSVYQYEVHLQEYIVDDAVDEVDAVYQVLDGGGNLGALEYVEVDDTKGLPLERVASDGLAKRLYECFDCGDDFLPSIQRIDKQT